MHLSGPAYYFDGSPSPAQVGPEALPQPIDSTRRQRIAGQSTRIFLMSETRRRLLRVCADDQFASLQKRIVRISVQAPLVWKPITRGMTQLLGLWRELSFFCEQRLLRG